MNPIVLCCAVLVMSAYLALLLFVRMKDGESELWDMGLFVGSVVVGIPFGIMIGSAPESSFLGATIWRQIAASLFPWALFGVYFCWLISACRGEKDLSSTVGAIEWHYNIVGMFPLEAQIVGFKRVAPGSEIVIPYEFLDRKVTKIGEKAFMGHEELEKVSFDVLSCVREIGDKAFYGCSNLQAMEMPCAVSIVRDNAFANCTRLKEVAWNVSDYVDCRIGRRAFAGCANLEAFVVPMGKVGENAFADCLNLKKLSIPLILSKEVKSWGVPSECEIVIRKREDEASPNLQEDSVPDSLSEAFRKLGVSGKNSLEEIREAYLLKLKEATSAPDKVQVIESACEELNHAYGLIKNVIAKEGEA